MSLVCGCLWSPLHFKQTGEVECGPRKQAASVDGTAPTVTLLGMMIEFTSGIYPSFIPHFEVCLRSSA